MGETIQIGCACGQTRLEVEGRPIESVECCCNTPVYLEFKGGHWLSLFAELWPSGTKPKATMVSDFPEGATLPDDIRNAKKHSLGFFAKLFWAWVAMGFRKPKTPNTREINV